MVVFVADQHAFACPPHAINLVVFFQTLQSREDGGVLFRLSILCAEGVVAEGV